MEKMISLILSVMIVIGLLAGCGSGKPDAQSGRTITDGAGRQVEVPEKVESIVCVGVGALRYTCYMGAADLVVGVEDHEITRGIDRLYNYVNHGVSRKKTTESFTMPCTALVWRICGADS